MDDFKMVSEFLKYGGVPVLIFVIWMAYHKAQRQADKETHEASVKMFKEIIDGQAKREEQHFELLKEMIEQQSYVGERLSRLEQKMDTNHWCPIVRENSRGK
mgnify:CR=1 FL=1